MSLSKLPFYLLLIQKPGNLSLVLMPGSRETPNMMTAVVPHSLELESQANSMVVENVVGTPTAVAIIILPIHTQCDAGMYEL